MYNAMNRPRRGSYDIINQEQVKQSKAFPVRGNSKQTGYDLQRRRVSDLSDDFLPDIKKNNDLFRRKYSLLDQKEFKKLGFGSPKFCNPAIENEEDDDVVSLPRIPSVTPEPEIIREKGQDLETTEPCIQEEIIDLNPAVSYRPKYCWCLRCQLMFTMFKTGDPELAKWGNYPCFKR